MEMQQDIKKILLSAEDIRARELELAAELTDRYKGSDPLVLCVLKGAVVFMTDLVKMMPIKLEMDFMAVSSYVGMESSGVVKIIKDLDIAIDGRDIIIVEDILDTGLTLDYLIRNLEERGPKSIAVCALLLKKKDDPGKQLHINVDYVGFTVGDEFVVGYGLDYNGHYRNLPYVGVLKEEVYS